MTIAGGCNSPESSLPLFPPMTSHRIVSVYEERWAKLLVSVATTAASDPLDLMVSSLAADQ